MLLTLHTILPKFISLPISFRINSICSTLLATPVPECPYGCATYKTCSVTDFGTCGPASCDFYDTSCSYPGCTASCSLTSETYCGCQTCTYADAACGCNDCSQQDTGSNCPSLNPVCAYTNDCANCGPKSCSHPDQAGCPNCGANTCTVTDCVGCGTQHCTNTASLSHCGPATCTYTGP